MKSLFEYDDNETDDKTMTPLKFQLQRSVKAYRSAQIKSFNGICYSKITHKAASHSRNGHRKFLPLHSSSRTLIMTGDKLLLTQSCFKPRA